MDTLQQVITFIVFIAIIWLIFHSLVKGMKSVTKLKGYNYSVDFKNNGAPIDLVKNSNLMKNLKIISSGKKIMSTQYNQA